MTDRPEETNLDQIYNQMRQVAQNCLECQALCKRTLMHCLELGGKHAQPEHIRVLQDCAEMCQTTANTYLRGSNLHAYFSRAASVICLICAQSCEQFPEDQMMQDCAKTCRGTMASLRRVGALAS